MKKYHIVFTTINYPDGVLKSLFENINSFGYLNDVKVWVIGDCKTPPETKTLSEKYSSNGLEVVYLDIDAQDEWGKKFKFYQQLPYNSDVRRNIGYLRALEEECEILISIDDDNFPGSDDFIGWHAQTGQLYPDKTIVEPSHFYNICEHLDFMPARAIYPRGFPFNLRNHFNQTEFINPPAGALIGATGGLWLEDPDVDAVTWLNGKIVGTAFRGSDKIVLSNKTWCPLNTQNTALMRELLPAYLNVPMGWDVPGGKIQRYGDIWGGYFFQALIKNTKYLVCFGRPLVYHRRNPHNYLNDMRSEFWGMILTDWLLEHLYNEFKPVSSEIIQRVVELSEFLTELANSKMPQWSPAEMKNFLFNTANNIKLWGETCQIIGI